MGVLKVALPMLGMVQIVLAFLYADTGFQAVLFKQLFGESTKGADAVACKVLMELLCPLQLGLAAINICSWQMGSTMRPKVGLGNIFALGGTLLVYYRHSGSISSSYSAPVLVCALGLLAVLIGLALHQLEPGLLTQDKAAKTPKKKYK
eukprot:g4977.t1